jgi:hypothetical protein
VELKEFPQVNIEVKENEALGQKMELYLTKILAGGAERHSFIVV